MENLLTINTAKMVKSEAFGYLSGACNLQPMYRGSCKFAGLCAGSCHRFCGRNRFSIANASRERKTDLYLDQPDTFYRALINSIECLLRIADRESLIPTARLNALSDFPFERDNVLKTGKNIFELYSHVQFIDYTKDYRRPFQDLPDNYHLTYSANEKTPPGIIKDIMSRTRHNVAAVFYPEIPKHWIFDGVKYRVIDGDISDLRHLDPRGRIVGLKYKTAFSSKTGKALPVPNNGFVLHCK